MALTDKLSAIGVAIREKTGKSELLTLDAMPSEIAAIETGGGGGEGIPEEAFVINSDCEYKFANNCWNWFLDLYGDKIKFGGSSLYSATYMFYDSNQLTKVPFAIDFSKYGGGTKILIANMFAGCGSLVEIPEIVIPSTFYIGSSASLFANCYSLRYVPNITSFKINATNTPVSKMFQYCYSLRELPSWTSNVYSAFYSTDSLSSTYAMYNYMAQNCYALDGVSDLDAFPGLITSNVFTQAFTNCHRLNKFTFKTSNGAPKVVRWKSQTIDLSTAGYADGTTVAANIIKYNSGITGNKMVSDDATYQERKDDPDWFAAYLAYSRYNHDSAVETINSLPDASAYLASSAGTNTIKFKGAAGSKTDGGAINTLTEEEIAVATAKGWTVSLV